MNSFTKNILATLIAAAIVGNVTFLWSVNARLARIETQLVLMTGKNTIASNTSTYHE